MGSAKQASLLKVRNKGQSLTDEGWFLTVLSPVIYYGYTAGKKERLFNVNLFI